MKILVKITLFFTILGANLTWSLRLPTIQETHGFLKNAYATSMHILNRGTAIASREITALRHIPHCPLKDKAGIAWNVIAGIWTAWSINHGVKLIRSQQPDNKFSARLLLTTGALSAITCLPYITHNPKRGILATCAGMASYVGAITARNALVNYLIPKEKSYTTESDDAIEIEKQNEERHLYRDPKTVIYPPYL